MVLARSRLRWVSAVVQDALSLLLLLLLPPASRIEPSSVSTSFPPGSYTRLPLLLVPKSLGLPRSVVAVAVAAAAVAAGEVAVAARWLAFDAVGVAVVVAGDLRWLWLRYRGRVAVSYS